MTLIFSTKFSQHLERLDKVLTCLFKAGLQLNTKKCRFAGNSTKVLGHVVSKDGIRPDPDKTAAVVNFPRPLTQKDLRSFLGLASYFRRFIRNFATIASPLHQLLRTSVPFTWTDDCQAFEALKDAQHLIPSYVILTKQRLLCCIPTQVRAALVLFFCSLMLSFVKE